MGLDDVHGGADMATVCCPNGPDMEPGRVPASSLGALTMGVQELAVVGLGGVRRRGGARAADGVAAARPRARIPACSASPCC